MKKFELIFIYALALVILCLGITISCQRKKIEKLKPTVVFVTDTITVTDTLIVPIEKQRYITRFDTIKLHSVDTLIDSILVELPIEQVVYYDSIMDSCSKTVYKAFISGYNAQMDSLYLHSQYYAQKPIKQPLRRFCWHVGVGAGYGVSSSLKPEPFVGVTLSYGLRLQRRGYK